MQGGLDPIDAKASERERARKVLEGKKSVSKHERTSLARVAKRYALWLWLVGPIVQGSVIEA